MTTANNEFEGTNMSKEEFIKSEINRYSQQIVEAKVKIAHLRNDCSHVETFKGSWSPREGAYHDAILCSVCGGLVELMPLVQSDIPSQDDLHNKMTYDKMIEMVIKNGLLSEEEGEKFWREFRNGDYIMKRKKPPFDAWNKRASDKMGNHTIGE